MHVQEFLGRLQRVKNQAGDKGWLASCPAHGEDRNPSLSIKAEDGKILLRCFTGCSAESIVSSMGLDMEALFEDREAPAKRIVVKEYDYLDASGIRVYQVVRYSPKGFSQRRPDGNGGWIYDLRGVTRVVYRLNQLGGMKSILWVEGEKDADRAWELGIPATCNAMGAGKWDNGYAAQLVTAGVQRVAVIPDNDQPGEAHAVTVAAALTLAGLQVRVVRLPGMGPKGDLSDYLAAGNSKDDLLNLIKATPRWDGTQLPKPDEGPDRQFASLGEGRYLLTVRSAGLRMELDHVQRHHRDGMSGELLVRVNGAFPNAKTYRDGILSIGDLNLGSVRTRSERANMLAKRSGDSEFDWQGTLEEFVIEVMAHNEEGEPPIVLGAEEELETENEPVETWDVDGFPILTRNPMVLFGDSSGGKSYFAIWIAGVLALRGVKVLYIDWEFDVLEHKKRLRRLFHPTPKNLHYLRADNPITREARKIKRLIADHKYEYLICDSIGFAVDGPAESHEAAKGYFGALRACGIGSLSLAHIAKNRDDGREVSIFGSTFFRAGARSAWFVERATNDPRGELNIGLHHKKSNMSELLKPRAYQFKFTKHRASVTRVEMEKVESLASQLPLIDRLKRHMEHGTLYSYKELAEELGVTADTIRKTVIRSARVFNRVGRKVGLVDRRSDPEPPPHTDDDAVGKDSHEF